MTVRCGLIAVSDRATAGIYEDRGTPAMREYLAHVITTPVEFVERLIPDEADAISAAIIELADVEG
jgi:molybdopterin adenylyltransferase